MFHSHTDRPADSFAMRMRSIMRRLLASAASARSSAARSSAVSFFERMASVSASVSACVLRMFAAPKNAVTKIAKTATAWLSRYDHQPA